VGLTSPGFFAFLGTVFLVTVAVPPRARWRVLLAASLTYYAVQGAAWHMALLVAVTLIVWSLGLAMARSETESGRDRALLLGLAVLLLLLVATKALPAMDLRAGPAGRSWWVPAGPLVALGASYYLFQAAGYLVDVRLGAHEAERSLGRMALFLAFFPKVAQGPIERAGGLLPQLSGPLEFVHSAARSGLLLFMWGLFKKVVIANRLAQPVAHVFGAPGQLGGPVALSAIYLYALQIYCDFSGYTDMARGCAAALGVRLRPNFAAPYAATSVAEFWRRWHISLSTWLLDYLFAPLQMAMRGLGRHATGAALLMTFLASGLWHGFKGTFVVWGLLHGVFLAASVYLRPLRTWADRKAGLRAAPLLRAWRVVVVFHLVAFTWIFFRADSVGSAVDIVASLPRGWSSALEVGPRKLVALVLHGLTPSDAVVLCLGVALVGLEQRLLRFELSALAQPVRWAVYGALFLGCVILGHWGDQTFIYLEF
jgi:alginate O-acetyltransferase complex protein AlgI